MGFESFSCCACRTEGAVSEGEQTAKALPEWFAVPLPQHLGSGFVPEKGFGTQLSNCLKRDCSGAIDFSHRDLMTSPGAVTGYKSGLAE
jgi:hypothetical protein